MKRTFEDLLLRLASLLVPCAQRRDWLEEWRAELTTLRGGESAGVPGLPGTSGFALGAIPHAFWERSAGWTIDSVGQDLKQAARMMWASPGFTLVAALTLTLGIGANASIFSLVNGLMFRAPAGIHEPERLVQIARSYEDDPRWDSFSWPAMQVIKSVAPSFSGVAGYQAQTFVLGRGAETAQFVGQLVSGNYFEVLGVRPAVGRLLQPADDVRPGEHPVLVLSYALWRERFGGDPAIVGRTVSVGATPYEVIGVAPEGFAGAESIATAPALWVPIMQHPGMRGELPFDRMGWSWIRLIGRLADGADLESAEAGMAVVTSRLRDADPINEGMLALLTPGIGLDPVDRAEAEPIALLLALIVGVVLLLTCTNVANLFLARASARRTEVGVRMALGAGRGRLMRQLVTESLLLALLATAFAVPLVLSADRFLPSVFPYGVSVSLGADSRVLVFLLTVGLGAGLLFGAAPAWAATRRGVVDSLREGASTGGQIKTRLRDVLVISQLGLSLGLVAGAALLGRSVLNATAASPGFEPSGLAVGFVDLGATGRYDEESGRELASRLVRAASEIARVQSATISNQVPLIGGHSRATVAPAGRDDAGFEAEYTIVGADYFRTVGVPIVNGRPLGGLDDEPEPVVVVNEALARMFWPAEDPIGQRLAGDPEWRVVGVAADVQMRSLRSPGRPGVYYPIAHAYSGAMAIHTRSEGRLDPAHLRRAVATVDPELPMARVVDLRQALAASMGETRTIGYLVGGFALLALALAGVGLYGLVSYGAAQRVREIGIRMALGAHQQSLVRLILARGIAISVLGVGLGLLVAYGLGQALGGLLFGVTPSDPATIGLAAALLLAIAGFASWLPARRASRMDPSASLRD